MPALIFITKLTVRFNFNRQLIKRLCITLQTYYYKVSLGVIMKLSQRFSTESLSKGQSEDPNGRIFYNHTGFTDLSDVNIVGCSVDTIRQLFFGVPDVGMVDLLNTLIANKQEFYQHNRLGNTQWHISKMGKAARYRFKFQSNQQGIVILFGSYYEKLDAPGQHLKIELSPHFISNNSIDSIWSRMYHDHLDIGIAGLFLSKPEPRGCAVHMALDYQGYTFGDDFLENLSTSTRTIRTYDSLSEIDLSNLSDAVASYGGKSVEKNYLIGRASSFQVCMYDKTKECIKSDKKDYFQHEWSVFSMGTYEPEKKVRRIELRFHHSVIREIGQGLEKSLEAWPDVVQHLTDIWRYGMTLTRYKLPNSSTQYCHPIWQLFYQDAEFYLPSNGVRVYRQKKQSTDPIAKNISLLVGNLITLCARQGMNTNQVMSQLKRLSCYSQIASYYRSRHLTESDLYQSVEKGLALRRSIGKAA